MLELYQNEGTLTNISDDLDSSEMNRTSISRTHINKTKPFTQTNPYDVSNFPSVFDQDYFNEFIKTYSQLDSILILKAADGIVEFGKIIQKISQNKQQIQVDAQNFKTKLISVIAAPKKQIAQMTIYIYTHNSFLYKEMNKALREQDKTKACIGYYAFLLSLSLTFLANQSEYKPYDGPLFRGVFLTEEQKLQYIKAFQGINSETRERNSFNYFTWHGFISSTKILSKALKFGNTLFIISFDKIHPIEVEKYSFFPKGSEVLFLNRVHCTIKDIKYIGEFMVIQVFLTQNLGI
ncbi:unnamed protein product [Paramecium sonneborni]|uniref:NAD(P)(+)--arginine ADP-ribosyltransferase n=1 Tax=Paramecium sonneborni TaxID=65129 RepID=A0A8S1RBD1_9CILI|nr:unnamed protein product [Paramecium sonneborni]CAD8125219.1 unnamed protein product [Paramecium sonneborni]